MTDKEFRQGVRTWLRELDRRAAVLARIWQAELGPLRGRVPARRRSRRHR